MKIHFFHYFLFFFFKKVKKWSMRNIFFPKMKKGTFYSPTSGGRSLEVYLPLAGNQLYGEDEVVAQKILNQQQSLALLLSRSHALSLSLSHSLTETQSQTETQRPTLYQGYGWSTLYQWYGRPTPYQGTAGRHRTRLTAGRHRTMFKERMLVRNLPS